MSTKTLWQGKRLPDLKLYNTTRHVGGSRRRGRNASNAWAADMLAAIARRQAALQDVREQVQVVLATAEARLAKSRRTSPGATCDTCGRSYVACKGSGKFYEMMRKRALSATR